MDDNSKEGEDDDHDDNGDDSEEEEEDMQECGDIHSKQDDDDNDGNVQTDNISSIGTAIIPDPEAIKEALRVSREERDRMEFGPAASELRKRPRVAAGQKAVTVAVKRDSQVQAQRLLLPILKEEYAVRRWKRKLEREV